MKKLVVSFILLFLCGFVFSQEEDPLDRKFKTQADLIDASVSFAAGNANTAQCFYSGVMAGFVQIDQVLAVFIMLDKQDAAINRFKENLLLCNTLITQTKTAIELYKDVPWQEQGNFEKKSLVWLNKVEVLMDKYMIKLIVPLSKPEANWTAKERKLYNKYLVAYDDFVRIDRDWVDFQDVYAAANNFKIEGEFDPEAFKTKLVFDEEAMAAKEANRIKAEEFAKGTASNGEEYYTGLLAAIVIIDVELRNCTKLDELDASAAESMKNINSCLANIEQTRASLALYTTKNWSEKAEMDRLTVLWLNSVEGLMKNYLIAFAEPFSRPDNTWTEKELDFYDEYIAAYEEYILIDSDWVDFQYVYAEANGFTISGTIDVDSWNEERKPVETE